MWSKNYSLEIYSLEKYLSRNKKLHLYCRFSVPLSRTMTQSQWFYGVCGLSQTALGYKRIHAQPLLPTALAPCGKSAKLSVHCSEALAQFAPNGAFKSRPVNAPLALGRAALPICSSSGHPRGCAVSPAQ